MTSSSSPTAWEPWTYGRGVEVSAGQRNLVGFDVEATDGSIGKIDEHAYRDRAYRDRLGDHYRKFRY
jgi:hypothetical protein